jgi:hypothetical protein
MRRLFGSMTLCATLFALCFSVEAQQPKKVFRFWIAERQV